MFWPWEGAAERVLACSRSKALWFFLFFFSVTRVAFLGRPRFLLFNLRPLGSSLALLGLAEGFTTVTSLGRSSSPQESCCNIHKEQKKHMKYFMLMKGTRQRRGRSHLGQFFNFGGCGAIAFTVFAVFLLTPSSCLLLFLQTDEPVWVGCTENTGEATDELRDSPWV